MPRVTYVSDLHLEFFKKSPPYDEIIGWKEKGDILCLAGDIGYPDHPNYLDFLAYCSAKFEYVFLVAGNHEYYSDKSMEKINQQMRSVCSQFSNVHFLNNEHYVIPKYNTIIVGSTLWTTTTDDYDERMGYNDFKKIPQMKQLGYMDKLHEESVAYLTKRFECQDQYNYIVLTHHLPSFELIAPTYRGGDMCHLFATNLNKFIENHPWITHWICGHSHAPMEVTIKSTHLHLNPIGYPGENKGLNWNASFELVNKPSKK